MKDFLSRLIEKFTPKNLVDGQFDYGVPGIAELVSVIQSFAYWGPNLLISDAVKSVFERAHMVDRLTWLMQAVAWSLNTIYTPDVAITMEYNTF